MNKIRYFSYTRPLPNILKIYQLYYLDLKGNYKLNSRIVKILLKENLFMALFFFVGVPIYLHFFREDIFSHQYREIIQITLVLLLFSNIPSIVLLINYYFENRGTKLKIDFSANSFLIEIKGFEKSYDLSDISISTYYLTKYHRPEIGWKWFWYPHHPFGYWHVRFNNGDEYYLSNLLVDFLKDPKFLPVTKYRYTTFPFMDKSNSVSAQKSEEIENTNRIEYLVQLYSGKSEQELIDLLNNKVPYQPEAIEAAKIVLSKKKVG
ncbi:hypothetical protein LCGC14_1233440 [marine sediment metagenome]